MIKSCWRAGLAALCLIGMSLASTAASAQLYDGQPIVELRFEGLERLGEQTLRFYLGLEEGSSHTAASLNGKLHLLWSRNLIDDISITTEKVPGGISMIIRLVERPTLDAVEYQGLKRVQRMDITDRATRDAILAREGDPLSEGELHRLKAAIESLYAERGYRLAEASYVIDRSVGGEVRVIFSVDEGDKVRIADVDFEGNTVFSDSRLRWAMKKTKESGFITKLLRHDVFEEAKFEEDLDNVRTVYRKAGYKNLVIGEPKIEIKAQRPEAASADQQRRRMVITIPLEEGQRWKLGEISIEGNEKFSDELLLAQFQRPKAGWLRSTVVDKGVEAIGEVYRNTGFLYARVDSELVERDGDVADLLVRIDEGDQYRVGRIEFEGNLKTKDKVIRRELGVQEGRILSSGALKNSILRVRQLEFFKINEDEPVAFDFDSDKKTVDLLIKGEEGSRTELLFGGGFSEIDGFFGQLQFKTRNFLGRGETVGVSLQSGARQDVFDLSYSIPWFLDRPQNVGLQVFTRKLDYQLLSGQEFLQDTQGATASYGRRLSLFTTLTASLSIFDSVDRRSQFNTLGDLVTQEFSRNVSSLRLTYGFDKRDSALTPTQGIRYSGSVGYAGGPLGGNSEFIRPRAGFTLFKPVSKTKLKTVAAFNIQAGLIEPIGGGDLFFNDRFYLGGESTLRGHRFRSIWVREKDGTTRVDEQGFPIGGESFLQLNFEYQLIVGGPFRILGFLDAANVFGSDQEISLTNLRKTAGLELRVNIPAFGAPLRFIWASNLDPFDDDRFEGFKFSIGSSF
ncbi:MAG: outer membrane protein assembly factor BamA [Acidobacteria bacterium]|nr:outer membrane protein assembly factor BamA [Acidobacteriota bacterium]